jgi:hypothetical protein
VCSCSLAKRLSELLKGRKQSLFYWTEDHRKEARKDGSYKAKLLYQERAHRILSSNVYLWPAYTVAELGEMLPGREEANGVIVWFQSHKNADLSWTVKAMRKDVREGKTENLHFAVEVGDTEADARAKMLIYLLENKLINV